MPLRHQDVIGCVRAGTRIPDWEIREDHPEEVTYESRSNLLIRDSQSVTGRETLCTAVGGQSACQREMA